MGVLPSPAMAKPRILILHVSGTNRDRDAALACEMAGGQPEIVHVNQLRAGERRWADYDMLVLPGGFSYGDALGAGRLTALDLNVYFADEVSAFVESGKPAIGICNGFQALVKAGILPGELTNDASRLTQDRHSSSVMRQGATLTRNARGHFECRWVTLLPNPDSPCLFTRGLSEPIVCPVAHGEGNFIPLDDAELAALQTNGQIALRYEEIGDWGLNASQSLISSRQSPISYPSNPNGSIANIAGVCNTRGNVLGLMPHPENHIYPWQHPRWTRGEAGGSGLVLFTNAVRAMQRV
jgi:phosphoribosylformylglycinamidine synthase